MTIKNEFWILVAARLPRDVLVFLNHNLTFEITLGFVVFAYKHVFRARNQLGWLVYLSVFELKRLKFIDIFSFIIWIFPDKNVRYSFSFSKLYHLCPSLAPAYIFIPVWMFKVSLTSFPALRNFFFLLQPAGRLVLGSK